MVRKLLSAALATAGLGCVTGPVTTDDGTDFLIPGRGLHVDKRVETIRERRFQDMVPQRLDFSCGSAALATVLRFYYQEEVGEEQIIREMLAEGDRDKIRREGFSMLDMKWYAERHGYRAAGYRIEPRVLDRLRIPAITLINTRGYLHFVVLKGTRNEMVYLADPAMGNRAMRKEEFVDDWEGVILLVGGQKDDSFASPLDRLQWASLAPREEVRRLDRQGLRNLVFDPHEF